MDRAVSDLERLARTLWLKVNKMLHGDDFDQDYEAACKSDPEKAEHSEEIIRAILKELREPSLEMRLAGGQAAPFDFRYPTLFRDNKSGEVAVWQAMIDSILKE